MKKTLFAIALCASNLSFAQSVDSYIFKVQTGQAYTPLTTGTNLTSTLLWDQENFKIPLGFTAKIGDSSTTYFAFGAGFGAGPGSDTAGVVNSFAAFAGADLLDRGWIGGTPKSPLRYQIAGTSPKRIFKFEVFNAGFFDEGDMYGTLDDSVNFQIWLYETSNIVEIRFGASKITNPGDYFYFGGSPFVGYLKNFDLNSGSVTKAWSLTGSPASPNLDSTTDVITTDPNVMSSYPANGTVYRFVPKAVAAGIGEVDVTKQFKVYPTIATDEIYIDYNASAESSAQVFNINGQQVNTVSKLISGKNTIDVSGLASGSYILQLTTKEGSANYKFVKQ